MVCSAFKRSAVFVLLTGLLLRALTPLGYMPAAPGNGLLFELCPDLLPPGFVLQDAGESAHHQHHGNTDDAQSSAESDQCQVGHLLFSAVASDPAIAQIDNTPAAGESSLPPILTASRLRVSAYQSRAPPPPGSK